MKICFKVKMFEESKKKLKLKKFSELNKQIIWWMLILNTADFKKYFFKRSLVIIIVSVTNFTTF